MRNERGAGRKSLISEEALDDIIIQIEKGKTVAELAKKIGISRQALYKHINNRNDSKKMHLEYSIDGEKITDIIIDLRKDMIERIDAIPSIASINRLASYAFYSEGFNRNAYLTDLLEREYFDAKGVSYSPFENRILVEDVSKSTFSLDEVLVLSPNLNLVNADQFAGNDIDYPQFEFSKKDILFARTDTDGFQLKALSFDRRWFVKSQAVIGGTIMNDWAVEIIASDICSQLHIPCLEQRKCNFIYGSQNYLAIYSPNFELDGYIFISFETLVERCGKSTREEEFIHFNTVEKLKWCAKLLSTAGKISYEETLKYMLDLALIDCLLGNVDRHTRNFGLFFDIKDDKYVIPMLFDNGMGLFEHDYYRDRYESFDRAMNNVYISPYGEDPFEMLNILNQEFDLLKIYPGLKELDYGEDCRGTHFSYLNENARKYVRRIKEYIVCL